MHTDTCSWKVWNIIFNAHRLLCELAGVHTSITWSLFSDISVTRISEAPKALAVKRLSKPMGPAPQTRTLFPRETPALWHAWTATARGSINAPSSRVIFWGSLKQKSPAWLKYRQRLPLYGGHALKTISEQRLYLPVLHSLHRRQGTPGSMATLSPGFKWVTFDPHLSNKTLFLTFVSRISSKRKSMKNTYFTTVPEPSWPKTNGV